MDTNETVDNTINEEVVEEETTEEVVEETATEEVDERDSKIEELEKQVKTLKIQKAKAKEKKPAETPKETTGLAGEDVYALVNAKVAEEDVAEVKEYATFKGITVKEALQSDTVKAILEQKAEFRKTSEASHTGNTKRTPNQRTEESLLSDANKGKLPESDEDIARLVKARFTK